MYREFELADGIDIGRLDSIDSEHDSDICSIFGGNEIHNLVELNNLLDFEQLYGNFEWIEE